MFWRREKQQVADDGCPLTGLTTRCVRSKACHLWDVPPGLESPTGHPLQPDCALKWQNMATIKVAREVAAVAASIDKLVNHEGTLVRQTLEQVIMRVPRMQELVEAQAELHQLQLQIGQVSEVELLPDRSNGAKHVDDQPPGD